MSLTEDLERKPTPPDKIPAYMIGIAQSKTAGIDMSIEDQGSDEEDHRYHGKLVHDILTDRYLRQKGSITRIWAAQITPMRTTSHRARR